MLQQFLALPFWSSALFGIIALVMVGSSWCLIGLVMGDAPKKSMDVGLIQFWGGVVSLLVSLVVGISRGIPSGVQVSVVALTMGAYFSSGFLNFFMLQLMSRAMQHGPNGIIWSIIQSAMIFPFLVGMIFFNTGVGTMKIAGVILLLLALTGFGLAKDNTVSSSGKWRWLAFGALTICAVQQNLATLPTYFASSRQVSSILCTLATASGTVIASIIFTFCTLNEKKKKLLKDNLNNWQLWKYVLTLQLFNLIFAYTLFYPGMFAMGKNGLGMLCYPMMVGSCIVSFTLSSMIFLKEKVKLIQMIALILCLAGLSCLALR